MPEPFRITQSGTELLLKNYGVKRGEQHLEIPQGECHGAETRDPDQGPQGLSLAQPTCHHPTCRLIRPPPPRSCRGRGGDGSGHSIPKPWPTGTDTRTAELPASRDPAQLSVWPHHRNLRKLPFHRPQHIGHVKLQQTDRWPMWGPVTVPLLPPGLCKCRLLAALLG